MAQKESVKHQKDSKKNKKAVDDLSRTLASIEHYFKMEIEELKTRYNGFNEPGEGHHEVSSPHMQERGDNDMSPVPENITLTTEQAETSAQVPGFEPEAFTAMEGQEAEGEQAEGQHPEAEQQEAEQPDAEQPEAQQLETEKLEAQQPETEKLPAPEEVDGCRVICKKLLLLLKDWKKRDKKAKGGQLNLPVIRNLTVAGDESIEEGCSTVEKEDMEGKGRRKKRPATTLLSPFTDPLRKKRATNSSDAEPT
ncbi:hypothetical protein ACE6H2_007060 [Prunus campanulata]